MNEMPIARPTILKKRKRPPKIEIPSAVREISADISKGQGGGSSVRFAESSVGVFSLNGEKKFMEDAYKISSSFSSNGKKGFFGVYDGHGGSKATEFVVDNLHLNIFEMMDKSSGSRRKEEAIKEGYLKTDQEFLKQGTSSGVCCVTALIEGNEMVISNLGDCRAILSRDGVAEALTTDHKPAREDERRRIEDKGGVVEIRGGRWRVDGTLAVSRSIGDGHLKEWVMAEPETKVVRFTPLMEYLILASDGLWKEVNNQEAVDVVMHCCSSDKKHVARCSPATTSGYPCTSHSPFSVSPRLSLLNSKRIVHPMKEDEHHCETGSPPGGALAKQMKTSMRTRGSMDDENVVETGSGRGLRAACKELVNLAVARGSFDDITVMVVDLGQYRKAAEEMMDHCNQKTSEG